MSMAPYDMGSGLRDAEAYRDELETQRREYQESLYELADELRYIADHADFCELDDSADQLCELIDSLKYISDQFHNLERDYDTTR